MTNIIITAFIIGQSLTILMLYFKLRSKSKSEYWRGFGDGMMRERRGWQKSRGIIP